MAEDTDREIGYPVAASFERTIHRKFQQRTVLAQIVVVSKPHRPW